VSRKTELDDLIAAFDRRIHQDHANRERIGCLGLHALITLAKQAASPCSDSLLKHIRNCAVCLDELKELRLKSKGPS
jgi:hypothetical protein